MDQVLNWIFVIIFVGLSAVFSGLNIALMSLSLPELKRRVNFGSRRAIKVYPSAQKRPLKPRQHIAWQCRCYICYLAFLGRQAKQWPGRRTAQYASDRRVWRTNPFKPFSQNAPDNMCLVGAIYPSRRLYHLSYCQASAAHARQATGLTLEKQLHSRGELGLIINEHADSDASELDDDEVEIIRSTLLLSEKKVEDIMTDIRHVYWLQPDTLVDGEKIQELKIAGWSRIPIFNSTHTKFYGSLHMKDLVDINFRKDPREVRELKLHKAEPIGSKTALDTSFRRFIAARTHLLPVEKNDEITGIVTIEDLLEEIIGHEIIDETDHTHKRGLE